MKIFESTQYVNSHERKQPWYNLSIVSQWDWKTDTVCYNSLDGVFISYRLNLNTKTSENSWHSEIIENLTEEMKQELIKMGYTLNPYKT